MYIFCCTRVTFHSTLSWIYIAISALIFCCIWSSARFKFSVKLAAIYKSTKARVKFLCLIVHVAKQVFSNTHELVVHSVHSPIQVISYTVHHYHISYIVT